MAALSGTSSNPVDLTPLVFTPQAGKHKGGSRLWGAAAAVAPHGIDTSNGAALQRRQELLEAWLGPDRTSERNVHVAPTLLGALLRDTLCFVEARNHSIAEPNIVWGVHFLDNFPSRGCTSY